MIWVNELPVLFLLTVQSFSIFGCKEYNQSDFSVEHLLMSMCRVFSCVVGRGCLLWPARSLGNTLLALALLHSVFQGQIFLLLLDFLLLHYRPLKWKGHLFGKLVLKCLVGHHRTINLQLLQHYWSAHRIELLWYCVVCLGNGERFFLFFFFLRLHPSTAFWILLLPISATPFILRDSFPQ